MALDQRCKDLIKIGDGLFSSRTNLMTLRQEIAEHYYFQRADFTAGSGLGADMADGMMSTYAYLARQELGNLFSAIFRSGDWFGLHVKDEEVDENQTSRTWLEWATKVQRRAMYDRDAAMVLATREADHDYVSFGDAVISLDVYMQNTSLLYRCWHTRDCAWTEDFRRRADSMHRKWKPTARMLNRRFKNVHPDVVALAKDKPEEEVECRHVVVLRDEYEYADGKVPKANKVPKAKWQSLYIDVQHGFELEATPVGWFPYIVPRFGTISGSQYGYSPCVVLPDARGANTIRAVLLEAGERAIDPPMIGSKDVFRSDFNLFPGGFTAADLEEDQKLADVFQFLQTDGRGLPFGIEMEREIKDTIGSSFFLNKIVLPPDIGQAKTAYEIGKRVEEQVRSTAPLFEPQEQEYSAPLCETTFEALKWNGAFGPWQKWPEQLQSADTEFAFENPLKERINEAKAQRFAQGSELLAMAAQIDPAQVANINATASFRDALRGIGWPADWLADEGAVESARQEMAQRKAMQDGLTAIGAGGAAAEQAGKAGKVLQEAGMV